MIDFPLVDTHLHVWNPQHLRYPWLDDLPPLNRPHLLDDYNRACGPVRVDKMVFVQCECDFAQYEQESQWVTELARHDGRIQGIVPWAPLEKGDSVGDELAALAANPLVKGIRRIIQFEPDPAFCLRANFVRGVQLLANFELHFELCITHCHMENTLQLVKRCPDVRFILDHIGKPDIKNQVFEPYTTHLKQLATLPNVWCKMSGLANEADHQNWTKEDLKPYIDLVLEQFGFDRVMYGGDWPVASLATDYPRWVKTLSWAIDGCSDSERKKLFRDNAIDFYRLTT